MKKDVVFVFDIDGTLSNNSHRVHYVQNGSKNWDGFFAGQKDDTIHRGTVAILKALWALGYTIVLLTGREEKYRKVTIEWCREWGIPYDELIMRPLGSREGDDTLKIKQLEEYMNFQNNGGVVRCIFDDRKRVVDSFRKKGYLVHHVAEGDF